MSTKLDWKRYVDSVRSKTSIGPEESQEILNALRDAGLGEWEPGVDLKILEKLLLGLKEDDVVTFHFKARCRWPIIFLALFATNTTCFEYLGNQPLTLKAINYMAMTGGRVSSSFQVRCRVRRAPISLEHDIPWMVEFLGIYLKDFTVEAT